MNTNKIMLQTITARPQTMTLIDYKDKLDKLSTLSKKRYDYVEQFKLNYYKEIIQIALEYGLSKVIELGFSEFEIYVAISHLNRETDFKLSKEKQTKLMNDCDNIANWIRENITIDSENEILIHDTYHKLNYLYSTIKNLKTKD